MLAPAEPAPHARRGRLQGRSGAGALLAACCAAAVAASGCSGGGSGSGGGLAVSPATAVFAAPETGALPATTSIAISVTNGAVLPTQALHLALAGGGATAWTATASDPWIVLDHAAGTTSDTVAVGVDPSRGPLASAARRTRATSRSRRTGARSWRSTGTRTLSGTTRGSTRRTPCS